MYYSVMWRRVWTVRATRATVALGAGLALLAVALAVVLSGSPTVLASANSTPADEPIMQAASGTGACQGGEAVPAGTTAIRLTLVAIIGPRVTVTVGSGVKRLAEGSVGSDWTAGAVTVPVAFAHPVAYARVCFALGRSVESVEVGGAAASPTAVARTLQGRALPGRFTVEYMRPTKGSWWSMAKTVARRMGLGHAPSGTWLAALLLVAMAAIVAGASWLLVRELS
jgi:hypothetical protein